MKTSSVLGLLNLSVFLKNHIFLLPVLYLFYTSCGLSLGDFFLLQGIGAICCLLLDVPMGWIADRTSKKKMLIFSGLVLVLRFILLYFFPTKEIIFLGEILYALVIVSYVGTADSYIYELLKQTGKSTKMLKRYGRLYFWVSCGVSVSSLLGSWIYDWFDVKAVIGLTILYTSVSTILLFFIPDIRLAESTKKTLSSAYLNLLASVKIALKSKEFRYLVIYSAFLTSAYQIFMWSMQPMMKAAAVPVGLFGMVFFMNHIARAGGSYYAHKILQYISLNKLGWITYTGFVASFVAAIGVIYSDCLVLTLSLLGFICLMIGFQVSYLISAIARIHEISSSAVRATAASINSMAGRLLTALCLILSKFILDGTSLEWNLVIFMALFLPSFLVLSKFNQIQTK